MIVRVDDFPHGKEGCMQPIMDHWAVLSRFQDAVRVPFCIGMMTGPLSDDEKERLLAFSEDIEVAYHGHMHTHTDGEKPDELRAAKPMLGIDPVFIPPYNALTQKAVDTLEAEGYRYICTGPETPAGLKAEFAKFVPSKFYGTAKEFLAHDPDLRAFDCITLHLTWENNDDMRSLRELGDVVAGDVFTWKTFFDAARYRFPIVRKAVADLGMHMCQKMTYDWLLDAVDVRGLKVLDFGCSDYPLSSFLAGLGAQAWWYDRDAEACKMQAKRASQAGVATRMLDADAGPFDLIIFSNTLQHNKDGAHAILASMVARLKPDGRVFIAEKLTGQASRWDDGRNDPCWIRNMKDHKALWRSAGLVPSMRQHREVISYLVYSWERDTANEVGAWTVETEAGEVCALLERIA